VGLKFDDTPFHGTLPVGVFLKMWGGIKERVALSAQLVEEPASHVGERIDNGDRTEKGHPGDIYPANQPTRSVITCEDIT